MRMIFMIFIGLMILPIALFNLENHKTTRKHNLNLAQSRPSDHHLEESTQEGFWKNKFVWRPRWVKTWQEKKVYVSVWKRLWGQVRVKEWVPVASRPPSSIKKGENAHF